MASSHVHSSSSSYSSDEDDSDASHGDNEDYILQKRKVLNSNNEPEAKRSKDESSMQEMQKLGNYSSVSSRLMSKMGYQPGTGLGKEKQGRVDIVPMSNQRARRGLGLQIKSLKSEVVVDWKNEKSPFDEEVVEWIPPYNHSIPPLGELEEWEHIGKKKLIIDDETLFCDEKILKTMLSCKSIFDDLEGPEMRNARMRSNPYETIRGAIFLNRAAMKMANMDSCFNFMFTRPQGLHPNELLYFSDICAGPGGFSEYILWKKKYRAKGFGFTLKGDNDFKLESFYSAHPEFFETHYGIGGKEGDGDIMKSQNVEEFQNFVLNSTDNRGVHFVMADGGFSVEGQENIQEILTKQLLLCQFLTALAIVRDGGHFLCKTFDLFTPFSIGLIYLLRMAFHRISLFKPVTSRPANSERYVVCEGYRDPERIIYQYLIGVNDTINDLRLQNQDSDVKEVVPLETLLGDQEFFDYVKASNERIANEQCMGLSKIHAFAKDRNLTESRQGEIREACLKKWGVPDQARVAPPRTDAATAFHRLTGLHDPSSWVRNELAPLNHNTLKKLERVYDYRCIVSGSNSFIIISMGGARVFRWNVDRRRWTNLTEAKCRIPRDSILEVELVPELKGEGKGQHRVQSLHVVDVMVLAGENVSSKNYNERMQFAALFVKSITQPTCPYLNTIRLKEIYRLEELGTIIENLSLKRVKGGGPVERVCYQLKDASLSFVPTGVTFIKFTKHPWSLAFSKSAKRKYFFNCLTNTSMFDCPPDANASYESCAQTRIFWKWEEKVKVHPDQLHQRPDLLSSDQLLEFIHLSTSH